MARTLDQAKRTAILKSAKTIILREGYADAKMSHIAAEAGVAPGTLYLYFESKESLAAALSEDFFARLSEQFGTVIKKIQGPSGVEAFLNWALQIGMQEKDVLAMARDIQPDPKAPPLARQQFVEQLARVLSDLIESGTVRQYDDPRVLAEVVLSIMRRVIMAYAVFHDTNAEAVKACAVTMLQHALFDDQALTDSRTNQKRTKANKPAARSKRK